MWPAPSHALRMSVRNRIYVTAFAQNAYGASLRHACATPAACRAATNAAASEGTVLSASTALDMVLAWPASAALTVKAATAGPADDCPLDAVRAALSAAVRPPACASRRPLVAAPAVTEVMATSPGPVAGYPPAAVREVRWDARPARKPLCAGEPKVVTV